MPKSVTDVNGRPVYMDIQPEKDGTWSRNVWSGGVNGLVTDVRRYRYITRKEARNGNISDVVGRNGRVG